MVEDRARATLTLADQ